MLNKGCALPRLGTTVRAAHQVSNSIPIFTAQSSNLCAHSLLLSGPHMVTSMAGAFTSTFYQPSLCRLYAFRSVLSLTWLSCSFICRRPRRRARTQRLARGSTIREEGAASPGAVPSCQIAVPEPFNNNAVLHTYWTRSLKPAEAVGIEY